ncbi:Sulf-transp domain-containing protein [Favolaschia claudopus]|uniref:Sulf-transp domain-containing protein n=1 Tax=Favolaschia claudopus TaxID=2862362 RepID=A0AAW0B386_9AGAR
MGPLRSFVGGLGLSISVHALLLLNGQVFGISGFLHRAVAGRSKEAVASVLGLLIGGLFIGSTENADAISDGVHVARPLLLFSGFLVGIGTKLANGCTSGHMIAGLSRFSPRSIAATATFFLTGTITAQILHGGSLHAQSLPTPTLDWSLGSTGKVLLAFQAVPFLVSVFLYISTPRQTSQQVESPPNSALRLLASFTTGFEFALALHLSNLTEAIRVITFLLLPFHEAFDPSLAFLALGALPLSTFLYRYGRPSEQPRLGGTWSVPKGGQVDAKLLTGAALFGVGWGLTGFCPGPGIVNLGRAMASGESDALFRAVG